MSSRALSRIALALLAPLLASPALLAHGGRWVGPGAPPPPPPNPPLPGPTGPALPTPPMRVGPTTPIGANPFRGPAPPTTGGVTETFEDWWEFNWEWFVDLRRHAGHVRGDGTNASFRIVSEATVRRDVLPLLVREAQHENAEVRSAALIALGKTGVLEAHPVLVRGLADSHRDVREAAYLGLGMIPHPMTRLELMTRVRDERLPRRERAFAAAGLGLLGTEDAAELLLSELEDDWLDGGGGRRSLAAAALIGLAASGRASIAPRLIAWLDAGRIADHVVRSTAVSTLGRLGGRAGLPSLQRALGDGHPDVRRAAALALGLVAGPEDQSTVKALFTATREDGQGGVKAFAYLSLGRIGGPAVLDRLRRELAADDLERGSLTRPYAALALAFCGEVERDGALLLRVWNENRDIPTRSACALALARLGYERAAAPLTLELTSVKNGRAFSYLALACARLGHERVAPFLQRMTRTERREERVLNAAVGLALLRDAELERILRERVRSERSSAVRASLVTAMGTIGDARFLPPLAELLDERGRRTTDLLRVFVVTALGRIADRNDLPVVSRLSRDFVFPIDDEVATELMGLL